MERSMVEATTNLNGLTSKQTNEASHPTMLPEKQSKLMVIIKRTYSTLKAKIQLGVFLHSRDIVDPQAA